jgi:conjugative transfer pilus assembly protein TraH
VTIDRLRPPDHAPEESGAIADTSRKLRSRPRLRAALALASLMPMIAPTVPAHASVASAMDDFMRDAGGAANVTGPSAFQGQSAGYYSLGNVWTRFPQKTTSLVNLQLPSIRAGCGGIDLFAGSFSFINAAEIVAMLKAVANNAVGFAFKLAIDTVCPECSKVMDEFAQKAQMMNALNISSCETAQGLVGSLWPKGDLADKAICEAIGNADGIFSDYAAAKHGCGNRGERASTLSRGDPAKWDAVNSAVPRNYTWTVLKGSKFFNAGGSFDRELAEYVMTMVGTIIYVPPTDSDSGRFQPIAGDTSSTLVTALLDGASVGQVQVYRCDTEEKCLSPTLTSLTVPQSKAIRPRVTALIDGMVAAIRADTPITAEQKELLQLASIPLYKILTVQAAYARGLSTDDRATLAEIASIDLLHAILDQLVSEVGKSKASFIAADEAKLAHWTAQINVARTALADRQQTTQARVTAIMQIIQKTQFLENVLATSMSPGMAASLDWSRAVTNRGLN